MAKAAAGATRRVPVVGVGASAGGIEAVTRLLRALPERPGLAFVVIQHLDPTHESMLPAILQKATAMPVVQSKQGMPVLADHVYVIPPGVHMCLEGGKLRLRPRPVGPHALAVNCFLASLAEDLGERASAVILSGTASDGALGVKAVKAGGGIVFAQDGSAAHPGMPLSAQATGAVDFVLSPEAIAAELLNLARRPAVSHDLDALFDDAHSLGRVFAALRRVTGVDFALYKPNTIRRRIMRRLLVHKIQRLDEYAARLEKDQDEVRALHDDLLIHVTHFFREPRALEVVRKKVLPRVLDGLPADAPLRVWVPGCSTGEEVYSLAVLILDFLGERDRVNPVQIFATDISESALEKARAGFYPEEIQSQVPSALLRRFFTKRDGGYEVAKRVRDLCVFARHDLTKDPPFANLDFISCCNVLIYLSPVAQQRVLPMFHYALRPWGALMLSKAETVGEFGALFSPADKKSRIYYKKASAARVSFGGAAQRAVANARDAARRVKPGAPAAALETDVQRVAERLLLARFAPAGVIATGDLSVLHFRGRVGRYLEPATGKASLSLLKMMPAHAADALKSLVAKAKKADAPAKKTGLELGDDGGPGRRSTIEVIPFRLPVSGERYFLVLFEDDAPAGRSGRDARSGRAPAAESGTLRRLRNELASTRGYLQTIVEEHEAATEELKSANEEIISSNEELQSTNEELEIAKEELQASNEELTTLNDELQARNGELGQLNNDLLNLLASVQLPIVMVSTDMRIRRFTPMAEKVMSLIPTDIGRPIGDLKPKIPLPDIEAVIHEVIDTVTVKDLEVRDADGSAFVLRVRPYRTVDNRIEGAVLVFLESEPRKAA